RAGQILTITAWGEVPSQHGIGILEFKDSKGRLFKPFRQINGKYGYIKEAQFNIPYTDNYAIKLSAPGHGIPARFCVSSQNNTGNNNRSRQANAYNLNKIPSGYWTYYERNFRTQVVYFRTGNTMTGRMGNICFSAQIYPRTVAVNWWGQVPSTLRNNYSLADFTADNVNFQTTSSQYYQQRMNYCR
ncbi:hypothetical protein, partial [Anaplasma marginale]|uniref:hypothetical protein n=1 Tax=Anaplasma marginale TaxID=770 RepID=UPI001300C86A